MIWTYVQIFVFLFYLSPSPIVEGSLSLRCVVFRNLVGRGRGLEYLDCCMVPPSCFSFSCLASWAFSLLGRFSQVLRHQLSSWSEDPQVALYLEAHSPPLGNIL